jgi:hypothetical protein
MWLLVESVVCFCVDLLFFFPENLIELAAGTHDGSDRQHLLELGYC